MTNSRQTTLLSSILLLALIVRIYHYHHVLTSDEAQNMLTIKAIIEGEGLREYFFKHPPLFILLSAAISYTFGDNHHLVQGISIIFSVLSLLPLYLISRQLFDERTATLSLLILAFMPLNIRYSTWVKQDAMLLLFFNLSLCFYMTGRVLKSGVLFGIASLTKEFAWFLVPIVIGWEFLTGWEGKKTVNRLVVWMWAGFLLSAPWYLFWGGLSFEAIKAAAAGGNLFEYIWHFPWYFYLRNLEVDIGMMLVPLFLLGMFNLRKDRRRLPLLWMAAFYVPLSLMKVKAFWYTYLASPAIAIVIAVGFLKVWDLIGTGWLRSAAAVIFAVALVLTVRHVETEMPSRMWMPIGNIDPIQFPGREYLGSGRNALEADRKVAMLNYNPTLQYYLGIPDGRLFYLGPQFPAMNKNKINELIEKNEISRFVLDGDSIYFLDESVLILRELCGKPERIGRLLVFGCR